MFLNKPEVSHRHESILLKEFANEIFQDYHSKLPYFTAALSFYNLERCFRNGHLTKNVQPYKAHLLLMFRESIAGFVPSLSRERPIDEHSQKILNFLKNKEETIKRFKELEEIFNESGKYWVNSLHKSQFRMKDQEEFSDVLLELTRKKYKIELPRKETTTQLIGKIIKTSIDRNGNRFGFIMRHPTNVFFHSSQNKDLSFIELEGKYVTYEIIVDKKIKRTYALNLKIVES